MCQGYLFYACYVLLHLKHNFLSNYRKMANCMDLFDNYVESCMGSYRKRLLFHRLRTSDFELLCKKILQEKFKLPEFVFLYDSSVRDGLIIGADVRLTKGTILRQQDVLILVNHSNYD